MNSLSNARAARLWFHLESFSKSDCVVPLPSLSIACIHGDMSLPAIITFGRQGTLPTASFLDHAARSFFKNPENQKRLDEFEASAKGSGHDYRVGCLVTDWPSKTSIYIYIYQHTEFDDCGMLGQSLAIHQILTIFDHSSYGGVHKRCTPEIDTSFLEMLAFWWPESPHL